MDDNQEHSVSEIPFLVSLPDGDSSQDVKAIFSSKSGRDRIGVKPISTECLRRNLTKVCQDMAVALNDVKKVGNFKLKEVTIQVEVTAEGGVELIGTAKLGGKGAITLTFSE